MQSKNFEKPISKTELKDLQNEIDISDRQDSIEKCWEITLLAQHCKTFGEMQALVGEIKEELWEFICDDT